MGVGGVVFLHMGPSSARSSKDGEWRGLLWQDHCQPAHELCRLGTHKGLAACVCVHVCVCMWCAEPHPSFLTILMSLRSTLVAVLGSITFMTASTAMGASWEEYWDTT